MTKDPLKNKIKSIMKCYEVGAQAAYLVITYYSKGKLVKEPLILQYKFILDPKYVISELLSRGADISKFDISALTDRLDSKKIRSGIFIRRLGWIDDIFVLPNKIFGRCDKQVVVDPFVSGLAQPHIGIKGTLRTWKREVAIPAEQSSYALFAIMLGFAAAIYSRLPDHDEGFIFNFFNNSSVGKSTCLFAGKSVAGNPEKLLDWKTTPTGLEQSCAAASDTLLVLDDMEKINGVQNVGKYIQECTHSITSGQSKTYAAHVQKSIPKLTWTAVALTCSIESVEKRLQITKVLRTDGDRVRMIDIPVVSKFGIWDRLTNGGTDIAVTRSEKLKSASKRNHGTALIAWLNHLTNTEDLVTLAQKRIDLYLKNTSELREEGDGVDHRIAKKFAIVFAAGYMAHEAGILPATRRQIAQSVKSLHTKAAEIRHSDEKRVRLSIEKIRKHFGGLITEFDFRSNEVLSFNSDPKVFTQDGVGYISSNDLNKLLGGKVYARETMDQLKDISAIISTKSGNKHPQKTVLVNGKAVRKRFVQIKLKVLDRA